uniref:Uncharacterized protein n=1 Tax=Rhizophora mucronata TaxID=61149 RepID=A0A2P2NPA8_RHIMU
MVVVFLYCGLMLVTSCLYTSQHISLTSHAYMC